MAGETKARLHVLEKDQKHRYVQLAQSFRELGKRQQEAEEEAKEERNVTKVELRAELAQMESKLAADIKKVLVAV